MAEAHSSSKPAEPGSQAYLPDFCATSTVFVVVLVAALVSIVLTLAGTPDYGRFLFELSKTALFVLWLSLLGCALGNLLTVAYFVAQAEGIPYFELLNQLDAKTALDMMIASFNLMDLLFYLFAVYFGYRYAIREVTEADLQQALHEGYDTVP